jgi:hypothetical protein
MVRKDRPLHSTTRTQNHQILLLGFGNSAQRAFISLQRATNRLVDAVGF